MLITFKSKAYPDVMMYQDHAKRILDLLNKEPEIGGDEAKRISRSSPQMPAHLEAVVTRVHAELSDFKHKMH